MNGDEIKLNITEIWYSPERRKYVNSLNDQHKEEMKYEEIKANIIKEIDYMIDTWSPIERGNSNFAYGMLAAFGICRNLVLNDGKDEKE